MEEVSAVQPSTSLSLVNSSSSLSALKDHKRPLTGKEFVLDIDAARNRETLQKEIERLGGTVSEVMDGERGKPFCVVSDYHRIDIVEKTKRGKMSSQVAASLPALLRSAVQGDVRIRSYDSFLVCLANLKKRMKVEKRVVQAPVKSQKILARTLTAPYIKLEDLEGRYAPFYKEFSSPSNFLPIYLGKSAGKSIFHKVTREMLEQRLKEEKVGLIVKRPRPKTQQCSGYCDICAQNCENLQLHYSGKQHQQRISQPGFYDEVDALCGSYTRDIHVPNIPLQQRRERSPLPLSDAGCSSAHFTDGSPTGVDHFSTLSPNRFDISS